MIVICQFCLDSKIVKGSPRNKKVIGFCGGAKCRISALKFLSGDDLLTPLEEAELDASRSAND